MFAFDGNDFGDAGRETLRSAGLHRATPRSDHAERKYRSIAVTLQATTRSSRPYVRGHKVDRQIFVTTFVSGSPATSGTPCRPLIVAR